MLEFEELVEQLRKEARERQLAGLRRGDEKPVFPELEKREKQHTHIELAEKAGIGKSSMANLQAVQRKEPKLFNEVKSGRITINKAYTETKKREQARKEGKGAKIPAPLRNNCGRSTTGKA